MRIVFDTNVLLAGVLTRGICETLLDACLGNDPHIVVASDYILDEFSRQAVAKFRVPKDEAKRAAAKLRRQMEIVQPLPVAKNACRNADDLPILGTLLAAKADYLVTGDRDLLDLKAFESIPIIAPRTLHERLR